MFLIHLSDPEFKYFMVDAQGSLLDDYIKSGDHRIKSALQSL